ncbi:MAG: hypothetical protein H6672_21160 [Anaerolineaceae bacterium]|nr:hypothetical protein [Anaerolineaceae bacterium]
MIQRRQWVEWILANVAGLLIGSVLGATDGGLVHGIVGDLLLGASIGVCQWWALRRYLDHRPGLGWWPFVTTFGYTAGVVLGRRFASTITTEHLLLGLVFGVFVGVPLGLAQAIAVRRLSGGQRAALVWFLAALAAWIAGELVAFLFYFRLEGVPFVGLAVALLSGLALPLMIDRSVPGLPLSSYSEQRKT